jgi:hypothetical protein
MEVYHINLERAGYLRISIQMPNKDTSLKHWQVFEVQQLKANVSIRNEIIEYSSIGVSSGTIELLVYEMINGTMDYLID